LAKFKKKKSKPIADSTDSLKEDEKSNNEKEEVSSNLESKIPPTEKTEEFLPEKNPEPKKERILSDNEASESKKKLDKLFWLRIALAVMAGTAATFLFEPIDDPEERRWSSIMFMIVVFIASVVIGKTMRIQLASSDRKKLVTNGLGSYVFIYLFVWIVSYTLVNISETGIGDISSPLP
jgi:cation transport ATPase